MFANGIFHPGMGSRYGIVFVETVAVEVNFGAKFVGKITLKSAAQCAALMIKVRKLPYQLETGSMYSA